MQPEPTTAKRPDVAPGNAKGRNIIAIASGKGGVGKTWFAVTLTHALARAGAKTLLFDADLGLANVDIQLGLTPKQDLGGVIAGRLTLNQAATHYPEGNFDIIAGRSGAGSLADIPVSRMQVLCNDLSLFGAHYDRVILDLGAGVDRTVRQFTNISGSCIVVTSDEPTALTDAYAFIKVTHTECPDADFKVVINTANSIREGERTFNTLLKACQGFLKISPPLIGVIRRDNRVRDAIRAQAPLLIRYPHCEAANDVESIAGKLLG
jgi:flagellar biosynthesis protein FlhG